MKNKIHSNNQKWIIFIMVIAIIAIVICATISKKPPSKKEAEEMIYNKVKDILSYETSSNPLTNALADNVNIVVEGIEYGNDGYIAICTVGNHDFSSAFEKIPDSNDTITLNQFTADFLDILKHEEVVYETVQIRINKDKSGIYQVNLTEKDMDALTGGFITHCASYYEVN